MNLGGLQKTTLIDFPGRVACTVFTIGCNFRCPFCHNKDLVLNIDKTPVYPEEDFFKFLEKRKKILDGVCITGGEPTLHQDLPEFIQKIKNLGLEVKLDTNGTNPEMLESLYENDLIEMVAMDLKNNFFGYKKAIGTKTDIEKIKRSIKIIYESKKEYEFRTTVVPKIHDSKSLAELAKELFKITKDKKTNYFLQKFRPKNTLDASFEKTEPFSDQEMKEFLKKVKKFLTQTKIRGLNHE